MAKRYYVVTAGRKPGVYMSWEEAAPHVLGIPKAVYRGYDSETEAFTVYGRATMAGEKRVLGADGSETSSQPATCARKSERESQVSNARNDTKVEIKRENPPEETVIQCPPTSSSRSRSTIQRAGTLPSQPLPSSSNNLVQRSRTAPNLDSRSTPFTPKKSARRREPPVSNVGRSRAASISTDGSVTDDETVPSSPATDVSTTLSPTFGRHPLPTPPRDMTPSRPSPGQQEGRGDADQANLQCRGSGAYESRNHQTPATRSAHTTSALPSKTAANASGTPARNTTRRGTSRQHQPMMKVAWGSSSSTNRAPLIQRGTSNPTLRTHHDRNRGRPLPSTDGSSRLTHASDEERPADGLGLSTGDSDYYTPSLRDSEMSDADSGPSKRASSPTSKRKGKRRASPPSPSSLRNQSSPVQGSFSTYTSLPSGSSLRDLKSLSGPTHKKHRGRYSRPPSPSNGVDCPSVHDQTPAQDPSQALGQDVCHCAGPCPSCHKPRPPSFPPQFHPMMFHPAFYQHLYFPPPHMQAGYQLPYYGPPPYPYPYAMPQKTDPIPSISSTQPIPPPSGYPMPTPLATHPPTSHPLSALPHASPTPPPTSSFPAPASPTSSPVPSPSLVAGTPPMDPLSSNQVPPELLDALDQFYQPPQRLVRVIDSSCDPRSPYSKKSTVPAFPNSPIALGRPGTPLSPLKGLGLAL